MMKYCRLAGAGVGVLGLVLCGTAFADQEFDRYREFELGSELATVSSVTGAAASAVAVIHQRPALIQELTWRPKYGARSEATLETESVDHVVFAFYNDRLFQVTVEYERDRTEGLADADLVDAISAIYGPHVKPAAGRTGQGRSTSDASGTALARWGNAESSIMLYRMSSYAKRFRMVVTAEPIAALARVAAAQALVLDTREAPAREAAREKKEAAERQAAEEDARSTNKAVFRP